jgi:outer membrane receptor for ferrienterochelin and colicin
MHFLFPAHKSVARGCAAPIAALALIGSGLCQAQDADLLSLKAMSFDQLLRVDIPTVYGASKHEQKITEAPSEVTVITRDEIQKYGYRTLAEILRSVRDFYVTYDRNYGYIGVRGFNRPGDFGGRILLLVDGHRLNEPLYDSAFNMTDFIVDVDLIERVEVIRGPGSSLYGNNAFFAVINVITRKGGDVKGVEVSGNAGSFESYKSRLTYGKTFGNGLDILFSGSLFDSQGHKRLFFPEFKQPENNNGIAEGLDRDRFYSALTTISYNGFTLQGAFISRWKGVPTAAYGVAFNDPRDHTLDTRGYLDLTYAHSFGDDTSIKARAYYDYYGFNEDYPNNVAGPGEPRHIVLNRDVASAQWWGTELQFTKRLFDSHRVTLGAEYRSDFQLVQKNFDVEPAATYLDTKRSEESYGLYVQDEWSVFKDFMLNAGVRYDHFSAVGSTFNPRAALIYNPFKDTTLKLLYGRAFRAPNSYELFYSSPFQKINPDLKPEHIESYEVALEQTLNKNLRLTATGFYNRIKNLISEQTDSADGMLFFGNVDNAATKGVSFELDGKYARGIEGRVSYTFQHTTDEVTGRVLSNSPVQLAKLNLSLPLYKDKIYSGLELQYQTSVKTLERHNAKGYLIANWTLFTRELIRGVEFSASIYNLFDTRYGFPGAEEHAEDIIPQDGRTFRLTLGYRF